jgi:hypothetical protein
MRNALGQCGQDGAWRAEKSAAAASIAGEDVPLGVQKTLILLGFSEWHGAC